MDGINQAGRRPLLGSAAAAAADLILIQGEADLILLLLHFVRLTLAAHKPSNVSLGGPCDTTVVVAAAAVAGRVRS